MAANVAVIAGAGAGLSASLARLLSKEGFRVVLAARNVDKLAALAGETGAQAVETDVSDAASVARLFEAADKVGSLDVAVFNASGRTRGPIAELDPDAVKQALLVGAYGGFLVGQQAALRLLARGSGSILFT
ncbi:MAG: SDR family NAD(P)-dependent oxidoreductase, partial [Mesorhizobium sp.]